MFCILKIILFIKYLNKPYLEHCRFSIKRYGSVKPIKLNVMKTIEINIYKFSELSEEAKQKAIENHYDINVDYEWWDDIYYDAKNIGLNIKGFDIDRRSYCEGDFNYSANETANLIIKEHSETCETHKDAKQFLSDWDKLVEKYSDGINKNAVSEDNEYEFDHEADKLESEFLKIILEDYRVILQNEYEWRISQEQIIETIEANEYDFTENGEIY